MLNTRLDVSTRVLKRKPERLAPRRHNEGGRMRDRIYTPWALYVARASTASTKCKTLLMEIGHMQNTVWDFTHKISRADSSYSFKLYLDSLESRYERKRESNNYSWTTI